MDLALSDVLAIFSGSLVGFILGVIGGGGSVLAVPLLVYVVGVESPHVAIGTSAIAVALSALANLIDHARRDHVCWPVAMLFALCGVLGATLGSTLGKETDGQRLLLLFGVLMIIVAASMALRKEGGSEAQVRLDAGNVPRVCGMGFAVGALSGFFGIGGGFLVVPGLVAATSMALITAIGSSLVSVHGVRPHHRGELRAVRADRLAAGAAVRRRRHRGRAGGEPVSTMLAAKKRALSLVFAGVVAAVGVYVVVREIINLAR